jgi:Icc-related predicted phosphoesterase
VIRIAAFGDCHFAADAAGSLRSELERVAERADVLLLAGDLTRVGAPEEAEALAAELTDAGVPIAAVLGNHDFHTDREKEVADILEDAGVHVLEGSSVVLSTPHGTVGVAGVKGFGTGFPGAMCSDFGEPEMKAFVRHSHDAASRLQSALAEVQHADARVALTHYAPVVDTLQGERLEIHPFLGSYHLAEAIDAVGADLAVHGHAHGGSEKGMTPGGVYVRNVAQPVIRATYRVYCLERGSVEACA